MWHKCCFVLSSKFCIFKLKFLPPKAAPWTHTFDLQGAYTRKLNNSQTLTLQIDIFNVFNNQEATESNEINDYSRDTTDPAPGRLSLNPRPSQLELWQPHFIPDAARSAFDSPLRVLIELS